MKKLLLSTLCLCGVTLVWSATIEPGSSEKRHKTDYETNWSHDQQQTYTVGASASGCSFVDSKTKASEDATLKSHSSTGASAEKKITHTEVPNTSDFGFSVAGVLAGSGSGSEVTWSATLQQRFFWLTASPKALVKAGTSTTITANGAPTESTWSINGISWKDHNNTQSQAYKTSTVTLNRDMWDKMKWTPNPVPNGYLFPPAGAYTVSATTTETENARSAAIIVNVVDVEFVVPSGDPVNNPSSSNEFVFDNTPTGTLTITLSAKVTPASAIDLLKDNAVFEIDNITGSTKTWDVANPNGKAVVSGDSLTATVTFSGLPAENSSFGKKAAKITCSGSGLSFEKTNDFEVFFPRNATNHPGGQSGSPNWFHYWNQVYPYSNIHYIPDAGFGQVPAMRFWSYTLSRDKTRIEIGSSHPAKGRAYGIGKDLSGIDCYIGTVIHEKKHVEQISLADALLPTYGQDSFRYGWSWNIMPHNHWTKGADGAWGIANVDDDGNGIVDDAKSNTPFEPGRGDDINLTNPLYYDWPNSWTLPGSPYLSASPYPVEGAAVEATDMSMDDNKYARSDWGAPGKNHGKLNEWNN